MAIGLGLTPSHTKRNLAQIRALNAHHAAKDNTFSGEDGGEVAKKIPALVVQHGLLGAMAFAIDKKEKKDGSGYYKAFAAVLAHLQDAAIADPTAKGAEDVEAWFDKLAEGSAAQLRAATAETLDYLSYFRRFAKKGDTHAQDSH